MEPLPINFPFGNLPPEIRILIWKAAFSRRPQGIFRVESVTGPEDGPDTPVYRVHFRQPSVARVCRESWQVLRPLPKYRPEVDSEFFANPSWNLPIWDWFDADMDSIMLPPRVQGEHLKVLDGIVHGIRRIIVPGIDFQRWSTVGEYQLLERLESLSFFLETVQILPNTMELATKLLGHSMPLVIDVDDEHEVEIMNTVLRDTADGVDDWESTLETLREKDWRIGYDSNNEEPDFVDWEGFKDYAMDDFNNDTWWDVIREPRILDLKMKRVVVFEAKEPGRRGI